MDFHAHKVKRIWAPRKGTPANWRMWSKGGQVIPIRHPSPQELRQAEKELLSQPPKELYLCKLDRNNAIITASSRDAWKALGEQVIRECCYPKLVSTGTFVVGSVASLALGKIPHKIGGIPRTIDLTSWTWHLVLDEGKVADWLQVYGTSKDSLILTEYS